MIAVRKLETQDIDIKSLLSMQKTLSKVILSQPFIIFQDVIFFNCRALVASVPFFTNADAAFVSDVVCKLAYEVFQPGCKLLHDPGILLEIKPLKDNDNIHNFKLLPLSNNKVTTNIK